MVVLCTYLPPACMLASWSGVCVLDGINRPDIRNNREDFGENLKAILCWWEETWLGLVCTKCDSLPEATFISGGRSRGPHVPQSYAAVP